jgi:lambda family phage portal protein
VVSIIDRAIAYVSPRLGAARARDKLSVSATSGYAAAKRELAALRNLSVKSQHADADTLPNLDVIRARSRHLIMNAPIAGGAVNTVVTNVVGVGFRMSPQADGVSLAALAGVSREQVKVFEAAAEREWRLFCRAEHCDVAGQMGFAAMQELAFRAVLGSGDCFVAIVQAPPGRPIDFALQLIEADRVSNPQFKTDGDLLAGGVEYIAGGRPVAYHVSEIDRVNSMKTSWRRMPSTAPDGSPRMLHLIHRDRIGQSRGVPYLAPVMAALADLDRYTQAEITAAVLNASIAILGESPGGDSPLKAESALAGGANNSNPGFRRAEIDFEPGMVLEGFMPGETVKSFDATRPNAGFDPFVQAVLRQVGARLGLPFEILVLHFTASYSAARAALLQAWAFYRMRRAWLASSLCQPVYELVLANAIMRGRIVAPGFLSEAAIRAAWSGARWTGPSPGQIDPLKEVKAAEMRLALRLTTRTRETAEMTGDEWEQVVTEFGEELALMKSLGVPEVDPAPPLAVAIDTDQADLTAPDAVDPAEIGDLEAA